MSKDLQNATDLGTGTRIMYKSQGTLLPGSLTSIDLTAGLFNVLILEIRMDF